MELHLTATDCHLPYEISQCYLPPDTSEHTPALTPARQAGTPFTYPPVPQNDERLSRPRFYPRTPARTVHMYVLITVYNFDTQYSTEQF